MFTVELTSSFNFAMCAVLAFIKFRFCKAGACKMSSTIISTKVYNTFIYMCVCVFVCTFISFSGDFQWTVICVRIFKKMVILQDWWTNKRSSNKKPPPPLPPGEFWSKLPLSGSANSFYLYIYMLYKLVFFFLMLNQ